MKTKPRLPPESFLQRLLLLASLLLASLPGWSSSIRQLSFPELSNQAQVIFHGRVSGRHERLIDGLHYTFVRFTVIEALKGAPPGELELRFLGGADAENSLKVSDSKVPGDGEEGVYFIESLDRFLVNPLLGWSQGAFLVRQNSQGLQVVIPAPQGVEAEISVYKNSALVEKVSEAGFARNVVGKSLQPGTVPMELDEFKAMVRQAVQ